jgi:hypothetical protein
LLVGSLLVDIGSNSKRTGLLHIKKLHFVTRRGGDSNLQSLVPEVDTIAYHNAGVCIVKQLDSLSTSELLEPNVSNECFSKVKACLYTNRLHQTKRAAQQGEIIMTK